MKTVFAYTRVSTQRQGNEGASLPEQKDSIIKYCERNNLVIVKWYEEQETAAKRGRKQFNEMMRLVKRGKADGLVFHKIDRSTRNLFEWAKVSSLPEIGIQVHYSHEPVDLTTTHGRTAADVAAVFASAYIRNLREEVRKGIQGRLKQGIYPFSAPVGYLNNGRGGKLKTIDPIKGPLVKSVFEKYATGEYSQKDLLKVAKVIGLSGTATNIIKKSALSYMLRNPFYMGLIYIKRTGETYTGNHERLIEPKLFKQVQSVLEGRLVPKKSKEKYLFQKLLKCQNCEHFLIAERQRDKLYYRCHECSGTCLREEMIEEAITKDLKRAELNQSEREALLTDISELLNGSQNQVKDNAKVIRLQIDNLSSRLNKLTDTYLDGVLTKDEYETRKSKLMRERIEKESNLAHLTQNSKEMRAELENYLEHAIALPDNYFLGNLSEKREMLKLTTSNILIDHKIVMPQWKNGFQAFVNVGVSNVVPISEPDLEDGQIITDGQLGIKSAKNIRRLAEDFIASFRNI